MLRVMTLNVNGIRSAARKGFFDWFLTQDIDVLCLQETKAKQEQLDDPCFYPAGYHVYFNDAQKNGYSGVAIYSKQKPKHVETSLGFALADTEGRYIAATFDDYRVVSLYLPSGSSGEERQAAKFSFLDLYAPVLQQMGKDDLPSILCGDWNIAHQNIDLKNWRGNKKNSGFLPEERSWLDKVFNEWDWVDAFRQINQEAEQYTWWSNRGQAWAKNVGWRIDYHIVSQHFSGKIQSASIYKDARFSDHAPLTMVYE